MHEVGMITQQKLKLNNIIKVRIPSAQYKGYIIKYLKILHNIMDQQLSKRLLKGSGKS